MRPTLLDAPTAAVYAGVKPATLRAWKARYGLTTHTIGGVTHYEMDELAAVLLRRA